MLRTQPPSIFNRFQPQVQASPALYTGRLLPPTPKLFAIVCIAIAGLYSIDLSLARLEKREVDAETRGLFEQGRALLRQGKPREALDPLRKAHAHDRRNVNVQIGLAEAQIGSGELDSARATLDDLLEHDSDDARANLMMARIEAKEGRNSDADSSFHRAIYGKWLSPEETSGPPRARLELAEFLASRGEKRLLLSEVLLLEREAAVSPRIPELLMLADAYPQAIAAYRSLLKSDPGNTAVLISLGKAELSSGNFREARQAFQHAERIGSRDQSLDSLVDSAERALSLDPTPRLLSSAEKYIRATALLKLVAGKAGECFSHEQAPGDAPAYLAEIGRVLGQPASRAPSNEMSEALLSLAERLWRSIPQHCREAPAGDVLPVVMKKITQ